MPKIIPARVIERCFDCDKFEVYHETTPDPDNLPWRDRHYPFCWKTGLKLWGRRWGVTIPNSCPLSDAPEEESDGDKGK